ncbi:MAG: hypothetical protein J7J87_03165 [Candidatus Diapherotrites archaeon]|nr:hypothetical protein [Candidatus Diapherotrites archaeon]
MVIIYKKGSNFQLSLLDSNAAKLGLKPHAEYELIEITNGVFALVEKKSADTKFKAIDEKIFSLLKRKKLAERVEGKFEKFLNGAELKRFRELIKQGRIVPFKLSEKYKKAVYKTPEEIKKLEEKEREKVQTQKQQLAKSYPLQPMQRASIAEPASAHLKPVVLPRFDQAKQFEKHDYAIIKDEVAAKELSSRLSSEIKRKEVLGIRTFDGEYCVIKKDLYDKYAPVILKYIKDNSPINADRIALDLRIDKPLVKIVCELLREKGEILERRRELYEYVE